MIPFEPLDDVDDDEIENVILNEEEIKIKTQVWMELNKEYLQEQEGTCPFTGRKFSIVKLVANVTHLVLSFFSIFIFNRETRSN